MRIKDEDIAWVEADDQVIILDTRTSMYSSVSKSGSILWKLLITGATAAELEARLQDVYGIDHATAARDVADFVTLLVTRDLLDEQG